MLLLTVKMNKFNIYFLKTLRKAWGKVFHEEHLKPLQRIADYDIISDIVFKLLIGKEPCMIARYGAFELGVVCNYLGIKSNNHSVLNFMRGISQEWWWNEKLLDSLNKNARVFPNNHQIAEKFSLLMLEDSKLLDVLASWQKNEQLLADYIPESVIKVDRDNLNPFFAKRPWTHALEGKRVVVIHPFYQSINSQYKRKSKIFPNGFLPDFSLRVIPAVQSIGGKHSNYSNWFEALEWMKNELDKESYDIALLGCGAYGFPLAAHAKRTGHKAVHLGGSLQLFFGIKGKRWEGNGYVNGPNNYSSFFNDYWIRPSISETPKSFMNIENGCYW